MTTVSRENLDKDRGFPSSLESKAIEKENFLDAGGLEPQLCSLDRHHVPSGPAAHHHHVALLARSVAAQGVVCVGELLLTYAAAQKLTSTCCERKIYI
jgi:hypothetical protein